MIRTKAETAASIQGGHGLSKNPSAQDPRNHPFVLSPHTTLAAMSIPVLLSLIAEPLTGLFDTAFISRLGAVPLAAVGVGSTAFSSIFWALESFILFSCKLSISLFNFLKRFLKTFFIAPGATPP